MAEDIVNLSGIEPKTREGNWASIHYYPTYNEVLEWKNWYIKNKNKFYFVPYVKSKKGSFCHQIYNGKNKIPLSLDRPIINYKTESNEILSSFTIKGAFSLVINE